MNAPRWSPALALAFIAATVSSAVPQHPAGAVRSRRAASPAVSEPVRLRTFGSRGATAEQRASAVKLDGALAELVRQSAASPAWSPRSANPAVKLKRGADGTTTLVAIDAVTRGDPRTLQTLLEHLGLQHAAVQANDVGGWLPLSQVPAAAASAEVHSIHAAMSRARTGAVTSQGDFVQQSEALRTAQPLTGAGVTVGVLSDSYDCYSAYAKNGVAASGPAGYASNGFTATAADDTATGDLPATVTVLEEADCLNYGAPTELPFGDEGRAMLQVVHDVAPGAALAFYTAEDSEADFANGIAALVKAGATVIADDVGYFDEPFYQDGLLAQAVDAAAAAGVVYVSAAGNDGDLAYENTAPAFGAPSASSPTPGESPLNFDPSAATTTTSLPITIAPLAPGDFAAIVVEWDQPYVTGSPASPGASSRIDVCITGASGTDYIVDDAGNSVTCTGANAAGADPVQILIVGNPADAMGTSAQETLNVSIGLADGTAAPGRIKLAVEDDGAGSTIDAFPASSTGPTLQGHPGAAGAAAVGAAFYAETPACGTTPAALESFSSVGGEPILFDTSGNRLAAAVVRQKPDFVAPDGGNDTFLGFTLASGGITGSSGLLSTSVAGCQNVPAYPNFFGTSAAAPHAAGIAALLRQANSSLAPVAIVSALQKSALSMSALGTDFASGYGLIQAEAAIALIVPAAPKLSAAVASLAAGASTTLTWTSINASACSSSGNWSGSVAASGSQTVTPTAAGTATYTLTCANGAGVSPAASVMLTVTAPPSGGGGGRVTALGLWVLGVLAALSAHRRRRAVRP